MTMSDGGHSSTEERERERATGLWWVDGKYLTIHKNILY